MTTYKMILKRVNEILKAKYPAIKRYGSATVDNATPPYFFVELVPFGTVRESRNMMHRSCSIKITYMQQTPDDVDALTKIDEIMDAIGMVLTVNGRKMLVLDYSHSYTGANNNIPQISFNLNWYEDTETESGDLIKDIDVSIDERSYT